MTDLSIHELSLGFAHDKQMLTDFLAKHHLNYEDDIKSFLPEPKIPTTSAASS